MKLCTTGKNHKQITLKVSVWPDSMPNVQPQPFCINVVMSLAPPLKCYDNHVA